MMGALRRFVQALADWAARLFETRLADIVGRDRALLERAIAGRAYELVDVHDYQCRVVTEAFTVILTWDYRGEWTSAHIGVHESRNHPLDPHLEYSAEAWLEAQGLPAPPRRPGPKSSIRLRDELELVHRVVTQILSDGRKVREALFYLDAHCKGYTDRVVVPEEAPPRPVTRWTDERLRGRGQGTT
jgi:hypothetical protein